MSINRCIDCTNILQFTTEHFTAGLMSSANLETGLDYYIYLRDFENAKFSRGDLYIVVSPETIMWHKYPQGEFVVTQCFEIDRLIDLCRLEFASMRHRKEVELRLTREEESPWMRGMDIE